MLSKDFFISLEHNICYAFQNEKDIKLRVLWCDGVSLPENEFSVQKKEIKANSKIELKAWFGQTGQEVYKLVVKLGEISKERILNDKEIIDCIPDTEDDWIYLDSKNKILEVKLK